jgi:hypothetical protein
MTVLNVRADLRDGLSRFNMLATNFGAPDVLRAEAADAAVHSLNEMVENIRKLGDRPPERTLLQRVGKTVLGTHGYSAEEYDNYVSNYMARYNMPTPDKLLQAYIKRAMVYYAKASFGERPMILNRGLQSDPLELFDDFQAQSPGVSLTRPSKPTEIVQDDLEGGINNMLYGDESAVSQILRGLGSGYQQEAWQRRRSTFNFRQQYGHTGSSHTDEMNYETFQSDDEASEDSVAMRAAKLEPKYAAVFEQYSRAISITRISSDYQQDLPNFERAFLTRLEGMQEDSKLPAPDLPRVLRTILSELHPDRPDNNNTQAERDFKFYSLIRDVIS